MEKVNVIREDWDFLIILDACRYDYFEQVYQQYIQGRLSKKISIGSCTDQWRDKSFPDYYDDIVYISANPQISTVSPVYGYLASEHFYKVYEVWKDRWDETLGTVTPESLTDAAVEIIKNHKGKRFVIHYLQPHAPYLVAGIKPQGYNKGDINSDRVLIGSEKYERFSGIKKRLLKNLIKLFRNNHILTNRPEWILRQLLHMPPRCAMDAARRKYGKKNLRQAYKANLQKVLEQVAVLLGHLSGTIVVTTDHGELLGEQRCYGHPPQSTSPILTEIPWLVIQKPKDTESKSDDISDIKLSKDKIERPLGRQSTADEQEEHARKLRSLGYFD